MIARCHNRFKRGFTLIEVLIALALSVMLATLLFGALHTYVISATAGHQLVAARQITESVTQFMTNQLRETVPLMVNTRAGRHLLFYGDERKIVYVGYIPSHRSAGGLHLNSLVIGGMAPNQTLNFAYERLNIDDEFDLESIVEADTDNSRTLLEAPLIEFENFGAVGTDTETQWIGNWSNDDRLPELIRIRIENDNGRPSLDRVVPILANVTAKYVALSLGQPAKWTLNDLIPGLSARRPQRAAGTAAKARK
ncbi:MAG: prepilin-type N-terminal cleavage/methylation domain-containing protein [Proteobacteria bacterium]|nr:MAG: prepilin-type N-terminal cleavage/methylation domain-containing protein [Pseudomonadota bacterium]